MSREIETDTESERERENVIERRLEREKMRRKERKRCQSKILFKQHVLMHKIKKIESVENVLS
jgi:hypothetical protein